MILPLRVFGSSGVKTMLAGFAIGPIFCETWLRSSSSFSTEPSSPPFSVTYATIASPVVASLREHVAEKIGALARPDDVLFSADLPKTRSGKIMRRLLRDIAEGRALGDTTTLADPNVVAKLKDEYESLET